MLHLEHNIVWCWHLDTLESRSDIRRKFWSVMLEKDGENQLDRSCVKWGSITRVKERNLLPAIKEGRLIELVTSWLENLLKHIIEGKIEGGIQVTGRRERRPKRLLNDLEENWGYWKSKQEALDRSMWTVFGRGYGPVVRQSTQWINNPKWYRTCLFKDDEMTEISK